MAGVFGYKVVVGPHDGRTRIKLFEHFSDALGLFVKVASGSLVDIRSSSDPIILETK